MHALLDAGFGSYRDAEQLDAIAELGRRIEIGKRDRRDALDVDRGRIDLGAESEASQDGKLLRGIVAFDVERRIGFRVTEALRLAQAFIEGDTVLFHAREDVIAGAVEDAVDAGESVAVERFTQRFDDRDAAGNRGLEIERHALAFRERRKLVTMSGKERLIGGHHRLAGRKRGLDRAFGWIAGPADHLDQHIDGGIGGERYGIREPAEFLKIDVALLASRTRADRDDLDRPTAARREFFMPLVQEADDGRTDSPDSGKTDFERCHRTSLTWDGATFD